MQRDERDGPPHARALGRVWVRRSRDEAVLDRCEEALPGKRGESSQPAMSLGRIAVCVAALCAALALASGCGESSGSGGSGGSTAAGSQTSGAGTAPTPGASSTTKKGAAGAGGLKYETTPKYASPSQSAPVQSGAVQIAYRNIAIDPDTLRVKVGSTVKWTNYDAIEHNVTSEGGPLKFKSKNFGESKTFEVKLTKPGIVHYECTIHPTSMNGTIEVVK